MRRYVTALALFLGLGLVLYPVARVGEITAVSAIGALGLAFLISALSWRTARALTAPAVILIALHYALALHTAHAALDVYAVLVGAGLYLLYETTELSISMADAAPVGRSAVAYQSATHIGVVGAGAVLAILGILGRSLLTDGFVTVVLGAVCGAGILGYSLWLAAKS